MDLYFGRKGIFKQWSRDLNEFDMLAIHKASNSKNYCLNTGNYRYYIEPAGINYELSAA